MSKTQKTIEDIEKEHYYKMGLEAKNSSSNNGIVITPVMLIGAIVVLLQFMMGIGMWVIQDRLDKYDAFEPRIASIEEAQIRFEQVGEDVKDVVNELKNIAGKSYITEADFDKKTMPIMSALQRIEGQLSDRLQSVNNVASANDNLIRDLTATVNSLRMTVEENRKELNTRSNFIKATNEDILMLKSDLSSHLQQTEGGYKRIEKLEDAMSDVERTINGEILPYLRNNRN